MLAALLLSPRHHCRAHLQALRSAIIARAAANREKAKRR